MTDYHISTTGTDSLALSGSVDEPYRTHAWVQANKAPGPADRLITRGGDYVATTVTRDGLTFEGYGSEFPRFYVPPDSAAERAFYASGKHALTVRRMAFTNAGTHPNACGLAWVASNQSLQAAGLLVEDCQFLDNAKTGARLYNVSGYTFRRSEFARCAEGIQIHCPQGEAQNHGKRGLIEDCDFHDIDKMMKNDGLASDNGAMGIALARPGGGTDKIIIRRNTFARCFAARNYIPEPYDGAGIELFACADVDIYDNLFYDVKHVFETGTQEYGSGHAQSTLLSAGIGAGATSIVVNVIGSRWVVGDLLRLSAGLATTVAEWMRITSINTTTRTIGLIRLDGSTGGTLRSHAAGVRVSPAIHLTRIHFTRNLGYHGSVVPAGHGIGMLVATMVDSTIAHNTMDGFGQSCLAIADPVGNDFPGPLYGLKVKNNILSNDGHLDYRGQYGRPLSISAKYLPPSFEMDHNLVHNSGGGGGLAYVKFPLTSGSSASTIQQIRDKTGRQDWMANGVNAAPAFVDAPNADYRLATGSPAIDAGVVIPGVND